VGSVFRYRRHNLLKLGNKAGGTLNTKRASLKKALARAFGVGALVWLLACGVLYEVMRQPPETFARFMAKIPGPVAFLVLPFETLWTQARAGSLRVGDHAPDFSLRKLDKTASVQLSTLTAQGRPVVLIFGSYT
jgi:hypothetical protein